jgi:hypothetical protein
LSADAAIVLDQSWTALLAFLARRLSGLGAPLLSFLAVILEPIAAMRAAWARPVAATGGIVGLSEESGETGGKREGREEPTDPSPGRWCRKNSGEAVDVSGLHAGSCCLAPGN